tara:strand:- start:56 stop:556 length:501 start_codon:yes stop_codon:yes gene_type:complete
MDLTPEEILALMKSIPTKEVTEARKQIENKSEADVNLMIRVSGRLVRGGKPEPTKGTSGIPWLVAMALFMHRSGATGDDSITTLAEAINDAKKMNSDARKTLLRKNGVAAALVKIEQDLVENLPKIEKQGTIKFIPSAEGGMMVIREPMLAVDNDSSTDSDSEVAK